MTEPIDTASERDAATARLLEAAVAMGIEIDHDEAARWIEAVSAEATGGELTVDVSSGVYGHRVIMADHDSADLDRFRRLAQIVAFADRGTEVTTALALSGSAAQARIHRFPADADFFERIHIRAGSREEACRILADVVREKALASLRGDGYRLQEVRFGSWPFDASIAGGPVKRGVSVAWRPADIEAGVIAYERAAQAAEAAAEAAGAAADAAEAAADAAAAAADAAEIAANAVNPSDAAGAAAALAWLDAAAEPGWCKLDWVIADPGGRGLANVSNMLDATWEAPDGTITPLDGFLDPYFQEVYLEMESIPLFSRLVKEMGADSVADYVERLDGEIYKATVKDPNYGKAARRLYNVFRITGRFAEAAFIRELFDEPVTALYQVAALLRTLDEAHDAGDAFATEAMVAQFDGLIMSAIAGLDGAAEATMVQKLLKLRDAFARRAEAAISDADITTAQAEAMREVDAYFRRVLTSVPTIKAYIDGVAAAHADDRA